jgi:flagellar basal-body rod modification protein FlgD
MSNTIASNYNTPATPYTSSPSAAAASSSSSSTSSADGGIGSTFLNLLVQELQNQDPTNPVDSTAMVGQMISLNQLDQLISINSTLGGASSSLTGAAQSPTGTDSTAAATKASSTAAAAATALPFDPTTMMPTASSAANAALVNPVTSPLNAFATGFPASN